MTTREYAFRITTDEEGRMTQLDTRSATVPPDIPSARAPMAAPPPPPPPLPNDTKVAAYFDAWGAASMVTAKTQAGLTRALLAFAVTNGKPEFSPECYAKLTDGHSFMAEGGELTISLGGQDGVYAEVACRDASVLAGLLDKLMTRAGTRRLDFDVVGSQLNDVAATERRSQALIKLQAIYPDMRVTLTLPGGLNGLSTEAVELIRSTLAAGVLVESINVTAMSFGASNLRTMVPSKTMAEAVIMTVRAAAAQLSTLFPEKSVEQVYSMMGVCPMIGKNDDNTTFTFDDAQKVTLFARSKGMALITFSSFQRDRFQAVGSPVLCAYSGVAQADYQYLSIFQSPTLKQGKYLCEGHVS